MAETVDYDPFNSYPVDYDPWSGQSPFQNLKGYAGNLPQELQHDMSSGPHHIGWLDATKQVLGGQLRGIGQAAYDLVTGPGRAFRGEMSPEEMPGVAFNAASLLTGGGIGRGVLAGTAGRAAAKDSLGTFGGQTMRGWRADDALHAQILKESGFDPDLIEKETGLWQGPEGLWRTEFVDNGGLLPNARALMNRDSGARQSEIMHNPNLYSAYPATADERIVGNPNLAVWGQKHPDYTTIKSNLEPEDLMETILHENMHGIQDIEGFAQGASSSPDSVKWGDFGTWQDIKKFTSEMQAMEKYISGYDHSYGKSIGKPGLPGTPIWRENTPAGMADRYKQLGAIVGSYHDIIPQLSKARYKAAYGETEAQNVALRYGTGGMSPLRSEQLIRESKGIGQDNYLIKPEIPPGYIRDPNGYGPLRPADSGGRFPSTQGSLDKAVTTNTRRDEKVPSVVNHPPEPEVMEAVRSIKGILSKPQINAKYNIPYGWGSNKEGGITYRDLRIPGLISIAGKPTNVDKYLHTHEQIERILMILLRYPYEHAHLIATSFERAAVEADGLDWIAYETGINKQLEKTEGEKHANLPPDLFTEAYSKSDLKKFSGQKSKSEVNYSKGMKERHCGNCLYFSPGECTKVKGHISAAMWCKLWKKEGQQPLQGGKGPAIARGPETGGGGGSSYERVHMPAVRFGIGQGRVVEAPTHFEIYQKHREELDKLEPNWEQGFTTSTGRFVSREEAANILKGTATDPMTRQIGRHLTAEQLQGAQWREPSLKTEGT